MKKSFIILILLILLGTGFYFMNQEKVDSFFKEMKQQTTDIKPKKKKSKNKMYLKDNTIFIEEPNLIEFEIDTLGITKLPEKKADGNLNVKMVIKSNGETLTTFSTIKVQGTSTEEWPKKNWTLKFYLDEAREEELSLKIGDSVVSNKWIAKADWIDPEMLRNPISYNLWHEIVESRSGKDKYEIDSSNSKNEGALGFPKVYNSVITINGEHYGLANLLSGHDPKNFNIDKNNPKHMYFEFDARDGYTFVKTWNKFNSEGIGTWIEGYYPETKNFTAEQKEALAKFGQFINSDVDNFNKYYFKHLSKTNMIDMLLYIEFLYDWDAVAQDIEIVTYDLEKFYFLPWDKDTTFGLNFDTTGLLTNTENIILFTGDYDETKRPWNRTYNLYKREIETRYKELREKNIFTTNNILKIADAYKTNFNEELWNLEEAKWGNLRTNKEEIGLSQILSWVEKRLEILDKHFNYNK